HPVRKAARGRSPRNLPLGESRYVMTALVANGFRSCSPDESSPSRDRVVMDSAWDGSGRFGIPYGSDLQESGLRRRTFATCGTRVLAGTPTVLIENGMPVKKALFTSGISLPELRAIARRQGFADLGEVHTALLETNGVISMFKKDEPQLYHPAEPGGLRIGKRRRSR